MLSVEFIEAISVLIKNLMIHPFVSNQQAAYQRSVKENLNANKALVLLDFAEKYSF